ncbi:MAG TPA: UbiA family prenyltransferase [Planctomycetota bacterium]|nr:UbiA family prenyltransferase [Planctomycetota bacterium]
MTAGSGSLLARLRLLRASNLPSPAADVLAGSALGGSIDGSRAALAVAASVAIYHAGMALNDWADRAEDAHTRPSRPIPSGAVSPREALVTGLALVAIAIVASAAAGNLAVVGPLAGVVLLYDLAIPRGSWPGPLALGLARALNLLGGMAIAGVELPRSAVPMACGYGAYVAGVSFFALGEDRPWSGARAAAAAAFAVGGLAIAASTLAGAAASLLWCVLLEPASLVLGPPRPWTPDRVGALVGAGLRGTLVFDAVVAASSGFPSIALACGAGYAISRLLARWIPPT